MYRSYILSLFFSIAVCSATQHPLLPAADQQSLISKKSLVSSKALQDDINQDNLLDHAKHLYSLAELAVHEYNHPTRVIGSDGKSSLQQKQNSPFKNKHANSPRCS
jgi:aminopeptidase Y